MKTVLRFFFWTFCLLCITSCQNISSDDAFEKGRTKGFGEGHEQGYVDGFNDGFEKPKNNLVLFTDVNPVIWKTTYIISVITILFSLFMILRALLYVNYKPSEWKKSLARWLVLLLGLLVSYFIVPRINLSWFFDPGFGNLIAYIVFIIAIVAIYFLGKFLATIMGEDRTDGQDIMLILISSLFLWFITYIVINSHYLFGHQALFGHHLIISFAIGIIAFSIHLLLQSEPTPEEEKNPILNHDEVKEDW